MANIIGHILHGTGGNGHSHYWATAPGFIGPFRATREGAQRDLDNHYKPGRWHLHYVVGSVHVGRRNLAVEGGVEYKSGPSGPTRYGTLAAARAAARSANGK